jgi:hypothetical protein
MEVTFHYTIIDFRALSKLKEVMKPTWFKKARFKLTKQKNEESIQTLKYTGSIQTSKSENHYLARRALRLPSLSTYGYNWNGQVIVPQVKARTYTPKNQLINTYQIDFFDSQNSIITKDDIAPFNSIVNHYRKMPLSIPLMEENSLKILQEIGSPISRLFYLSTTTNRKINSIYRFIIKSEEQKFKIYENIIIKKMVHCRPVAIFDFIGTEDMGAYYNKYFKICDFPKEKITVFNYKIHDRMSIWLITKPNKKENRDLIKELKSYILDTEQQCQTIQWLVQYIKKNPKARYRKITRDKILRYLPISKTKKHKKGSLLVENRVLYSNVNKLIANRYFAKNEQSKFSIQQEQVRSYIMDSIEKDAEEMMSSFPDFEKLKLSWSTLFVLTKKDFWQIAAVELLNINPETDAILSEFIKSLNNHDYKNCIKILNPHRELIDKIFSSVVKAIAK